MGPSQNAKLQRSGGLPEDSSVARLCVPRSIPRLYGERWTITETLPNFLTYIRSWRYFDLARHWQVPYIIVGIWHLYMFWYRQTIWVVKNKIVFNSINSSAIEKSMKRKIVVACLVKTLQAIKTKLTINWTQTNCCVTSLWRLSYSVVHYLNVPIGCPLWTRFEKGIMPVKPFDVSRCVKPRLPLEIADFAQAVVIRGEYHRL